MMTGLWSPSIARHLQHVAIADLRAPELRAKPLDRLLEPEVRHQRADHRPRQLPRLQPAARDDDRALVAVDRAPSPARSDRRPARAGTPRQAAGSPARARGSTSACRPPAPAAAPPAAGRAR